MVDEYICINCCHPSSSLFLKYSDNGIRLTPCSNCGRAVDAYIEYDIVLVIIDLMLQYIEAYRHFLMNTGNNRVSFMLFRMQYCHKLCIIFMLCNAYSKWIRRRIMSGDENVYDLEWEFYECLLQSLLEMTSFVIVLALMSLQISATFSVNKTLQTFCIGSYGNVFAVLSVIWHLHLLWSYRILTELFIFISHVQAQRGDCLLVSFSTLTIIHPFSTNVKIHSFSAMYNITLTRSVLVVLMATVISRCIGLLMDLFCFI
ncbi:unnamed protein product [Brugia pahangi]|uniref:Protein ARV n=1 Tax=Brugia pahangi TaxID=6280 RepID=A0A0N4TEG1_BRUPA|nr:unnamed protein product [Brugia pahangi]